MGYALITGNLDKGRYDVELDFGTANRDAKVARIVATLTKVNARLAAAEINRTQVQALYDTASAAVDALIATWAVSGDAVTPGSPKGREHEGLLRSALLYGAQLQRAKSLVAELKQMAAKLQRDKALLDNLPLVVKRQLWCIDLTDTAAGYVATAEIPGEQDHILIKPGAPAWKGGKTGDGMLIAREVMDPNQAYLNAAILPGWQKYKPTFRAGTILELNKPANKATVELNPYTSSAQRLPVNLLPVLKGIPVTYMQCNAEAFEVGDRVVVMFDDQDNSKPRVIGFVDNPKSCNWPCFYASGGFAYFGSKITSVFDSMIAGVATTARIRFDGSPWADMAPHPSFASVPGSQLYFRDPTPGPGIFNFTTLVIQRLASDFNGYRDMVGLATSPFFPATTTRRVAEVAIYAGIRLVCNVAATDHGLAGSSTYRSGLVKAPGGISLAAGSDPITQLTYTLTAV